MICALGIEWKSLGPLASVHYQEAGQTADRRDGLALCLGKKEGAQVASLSHEAPSQAGPGCGRFELGTWASQSSFRLLLRPRSALQAEPDLAGVSEKLRLSILLQCPASGKEHSPARR